jgi:hypothetical protein
MLLVWLAATVVLAARPAAALDEATGLYAVQGGETSYRWSSNHVDIPLRAGSGPTLVTLTLGPSQWPGRQPPTVTLSAGGSQLASFAAPEHMRRYHVALPPSVTSLSLDTGVAQPPAGDRRWLGVTVYGASATASGLPLRAGGWALAITLATLLVITVLGWGARRGYGSVVALALLALGVRLALLGRAPPGWRTDEVVSLVDAWHLSRTARDHLGHLLPLGAQEALGDWISPLLTYLELPLVALLGPQRLVGRVVTAAFGALAAPLCYLLARELPLATSARPPQLENDTPWTPRRLAWIAGVVAGLVAALAPGQIFLSRNGLPPALVPTCWAAALLAAVLFLKRGGRREAVVLAAIAGVALYAYPTMKLAVPLLLALAGVLALRRYGWGALRRWLPAAPLLVLLWLPFAYVTLFVPASSTRLDQTALAAGSWGEWLAAWWRGYSIYFLPGFYYGSGDGSPIRGVPGHGTELLATAPLVVAGLFVLLWKIIASYKGEKAQSAIRNPQSVIPWLLLLGALLIAPLPASLTQPSPHAYRAATIAPLYALLCGLGAAALLGLLRRFVPARAGRVVQLAAVVLLAGAFVWQASGWLRDYTQHYPPARAWENQDGLAEAMRRAVAHTPSYDETWISYQNINEPYIYLLAARPMPPAESQALIEVRREPGHLNDILSVGRYRFVEVDTIPRDLPVVDAIPDTFGGPAFVLQRWEQDGKRILVLRRMD